MPSTASWGSARAPRYGCPGARRLDAAAALARRALGGDDPRSRLDPDEALIALAATRPNTVTSVSPATAARPTSSARRRGALGPSRCPWPRWPSGVGLRARAAGSRRVADGAANGAVDGSHRRSSRPRTRSRCRRTGHPTVSHRRRSGRVTPVIGYVTTSTDAWSEADEESAAAIEATCERSAWDLVEIVCDRENGRTLDRPGLTYALEQIVEGRARGLVVSDLQRVSRSPADLGALMAWFRDADARLVALDLDLDTSSSGRRPGPEHAFGARLRRAGRPQTARNRAPTRLSTGGPHSRITPSWWSASGPCARRT